MRDLRFAREHYECASSDIEPKTKDYLMKQLMNVLALLCIATVMTAGCSTTFEPAATSDSAASASPAAERPVATVRKQPAAPAEVSASNSDFDRLQGTWIGKEIGADSDSTASLVIAGHDLEYRGSNPNDWYKGTFTLREGTNPRQCVFAVKDCASPDYVGKTSNAIYRLENGTLMIAGNEPGNPDVPSGFETPGARRFEFRAK